MIRASKLALRLAASLLALVAVALAVVGALLLSGPVSLPWLTPYIEAAAVSEAIPRVEIADVQLRLGKEGGLELAAVAVRGIDQAGHVLFEVPEIEVTPDLGALVVDRVVALSRVELQAPEIVVTRRTDGSIGLGGVVEDATEAPPPDDEQIDARSLLSVLLEPRSPGSVASYLDQVRVSGGVLRLEDHVLDRTVEADAAELLIQREADGLSARLGFSLQQPEGAAQVEADASYRAPSGEIGFEARVVDLRIGELADVVGAPWLQGVALAWNGKVSGTRRLDGETSPIAFELSSGGGSIDLPDTLATPLPLDSVALSGEVAGTLEAVRIDSLTARSGETQLTAKAEADWTSGALALSADVVALNVLANDLKTYWPPAAETMAREWVIQNITDGVVPRAEARLRIEPGDLDQDPVPEHIVEGQFGFENLTVAYVSPMPPIRGIDGEASFTARRMDFEVTAGHVDDLVIENGSVVITGMGLPGRDTTQLEIRTTIDGPIQQAVALIDHEPLHLAGPLGLDPAGTAGGARTDLAIGMPLHEDFDAEDIRVSADATLVDAAWADFRPGIDLDQGQLQLRVDRDQIGVAGTARVSGVPLQLDWVENLDGGPFDRRIRLEGEVGAVDLARLDLRAPVPLEGAVDLVANVTQVGGTTEADLKLDLTPLGIEVAALNWHKPVGQPGTLDASLVAQADGTTTVDSFDLETRTLQAAGSLRLGTDPVVLEELELSRLRLDGSDATMTVHRGADGTYLAEVEAGTLNLDELRGGGNADGDGASGDEAGEVVPFEIDLRAQSLTFEGRDLQDVEAMLVRDQEIWRRASVSGHLPAGGRVDLTLEPEGEAQRFQITSDDAGALFDFIDPGSTVRGGQANLKATIHRQRPTVLAEGTYRAEEFTLLEAPIMARLLTLASFSGIRNLLGGQGIYFDRLKLPFSLDDKTLTITKGRMSGSQVGLTVDGEIDVETAELNLKGTVVPFYTINRLLGKIPLIGDFLAGTTGEGAFAVTYAVTGPATSPEVTVNPLAVLAPGLIRELFAGLLEGDLQPPEPPPSDD